MEQVKVFLFWNPRNYAKEGTAQAINWSDPDEWICPLFFKPKAEHLAWLEKHGNPVFDVWMNAKMNCKELARKLGYWPEPYTGQELKLLKDTKLDDPIEF